MPDSTAPADLRTSSGRPLPGNGFDGDALVASFKVCAAHTGDVPLEELCNGMEQLRRIVLTLGSAFGIASSDITEKIETLGKRMADIRAMGALSPPGEGTSTPAYSASSPRLTVQFIVSWEIEKKLTEKVTSKYTSAARSILRLCWFLDFLKVLLTHLCHPCELSSLRDMAQSAYDFGLAPHHPWIVKKTIGAAMIFCPTEAAFWERIVKETQPPRDLESVKASLREFLQIMEPCRLQMWQFFKDNKLEGLP